MKQLTKDYSPKHISSSYSSMGRIPKRTFLQRRHSLIKRDHKWFPKTANRHTFSGKNALVGEKSTAGPAWRISRQHRRRCLSSMCYHLLRCQAVISTSCNVDQQCTMMSASSPSPPFYRKGEYPAKV